MFSDPLVITINVVAKNLIRINQDGYGSEYFLRETDGEFRLKIRNTRYTDKTRGIPVDRHNVELIHTVYPVSPATQPTIRKAYSIFENDRGDPVLASGKFGAGFFAFHTEANLTKLLNLES
jgi:hypothetical protein